jgi:hypothetical protein
MKNESDGNKFTRHKLSESQEIVIKQILDEIPKRYFPTRRKTVCPCIIL